MKIDLQKAYDSVLCKFMEEMMNDVKFPSRFDEWIIVCFRSTYFSFCSNKGCYRFFTGKKDLD